MIIKVLVLFFLQLNIYALENGLYIVEEDIASIQEKINKFAKSNNCTLKTTQHNTLDIYFDTPELTLLKENRYLKYQARQYISKKNKKIKYKESITYMLNEEKTLQYPVKHYKRVESIEEKNFLLGMIKRSQRKDFIKSIKENGIRYPMKIQYIFELYNEGLMYEIYDGNKLIVTLLNQKSSRNKTLDIDIDYNTKKIDTFLSSLISIKIKDNIYQLNIEQIKEKDRFFSYKLQYSHVFNLLNTLIIAFLFMIIIRLFTKKKVDE